MANETSTLSSQPDLEEELDLSTVLAGVIALLVVAIVVVFSLIVIVLCLRFRHSRSLRISTNLNIQVSHHNGHSETRGTHGCTRCKETTIAAAQPNNNGCPSISSPIHQGSRDALCSNTSFSPDPVVPLNSGKKRKLTPERPASYMCSNPVYSSTDDLTFNAGYFLAAPSESESRASSSNLENIYDLPNELSFSSSLVQSYASICDNLITHVSSRDFEHIRVRADHIREIRTLGEGQFGQVLLAETVDLTIKDMELTVASKSQANSVSAPFHVAVKKLKPGSDDGVRKAFEKETKLMMQLNHENIVRLLGVCQGDEGFIVMEYMENGDLNQYLKKHNICLQYQSPCSDGGLSAVTSGPQISVPTLVFMSLQIARGMEYLSSLHFIHRDLATRNCLVGANNIVKISDFGLSRSLYGSHYYKIKGCAVLPIRWMASECFYGKFSEKSDVWAFGVPVWEIFMLARRQPYDTMPNPEFVQDAMKGAERKLLSRPRYCPTEVYRDVMLRCWTSDPAQRADFTELCHTLE